MLHPKKLLAVTLKTLASTADCSCRLHSTLYSPALSTATPPPSSLAPYLQDGHRLGEVVLLHGGSGVQCCQGVVEFLKVAITEAPVVQVMAQARN